MVLLPYIKFKDDPRINLPLLFFLMAIIMITVLILAFKFWNFLIEL